PRPQQEFQQSVPRQTGDQSYLFRNEQLNGRRNMYSFDARPTSPSYASAFPPLDSGATLPTYRNRSRSPAAHRSSRQSRSPTRRSSPHLRILSSENRV